jgi:drug/metabolite transporter (DMT)-like permease
LAALQLLPFAVLDPSPVGTLTPQVIGGMLALGTLGTGIAYIWNFQVIERAGATMASTVTYLTPLVAIVVGALLLAEPVTLNQPLGGLVVLLGVAFAQGRIGLPTRWSRANDQGPDGPEARSVRSRNRSSTR